MKFYLVVCFFGNGALLLMHMPRVSSSYVAVVCYHWLTLLTMAQTRPLQCIVKRQSCHKHPEGTKLDVSFSIALHKALRWHLLCQMPARADTRAARDAYSHNPDMHPCLQMYSAATIIVDARPHFELKPE
jgi:hypothetical protein